MKIDVAQLATIGVIVGVIFVLDRATRGVEAVANINQDTPFEGTGVVGTLGNLTDQASGGIFSRIGSAIGTGLADFVDKNFRGIPDDINDL